MASADDERGGDDGRTPTKGGDGRWTNISVIFVLLLVVISHVHVVSSAKKIKSCYMTPTTNLKAQPTKDVMEAVSANQTIAGRMCYVLYILDSGGNTNPSWNITKYRYLASSDRTFDVDCTKVMTKAAKSNDVKCSLLLSQNSYGDANRTDFVCCCKGDLCNDPRTTDTVNPRIQYTQHLNASGDAACYVNFELRSPMNCTGKQGSQSMCYSQIIGGNETLDCAHADNGTDHCHWTNGEDGVCRNNGDTLECCCKGAFCNGDAMMNMSCRSQYQNSTTADDVRYGAGSCAAHRPKTTTKSNTTSITHDAATTTPSDDFDLVWIAVIVVGVVIAVLLVVLLGCGVCIYKLYQRILYRPTCEREHIQEADNDELSAVTIGVDRRTDSERLQDEDNYQPRDLMNPAEKADELRRLGKQAAGTSVTINPNEGSDFGDHTEARGGVFDDDSEAAHTTLTTTTDKATTNQMNKTEPPSINKNTQKKKRSAKEKDKGKEMKNEKEKNA